MQTFKKIILGSVLLLSSFVGCKVPTDIDAPDWDTDVVLPVLYTDLNINNLKQLEQLSYRREVPALALGINNGNIPPFSRDSVGLFEIAEQDTSFDIYHGFVIKGKVKFVVDNNFPISFLSGAVLKFWNTDNQLITSYTIPQNIPANTRLDTLGPIEIINKKVTNPIYLSVHNLKSNGGNASIVFDKRIEVKTIFYRDSLEEVFFRPTSIYQADDTTNFSLTDLDKNEIRGKFRLKTVNEFPVAYKVQAYLLDESYRVLDSLFSAGPFETPGAQTNPTTGQLIKATERLDTVILDDARIAKLRQTRHVRIKGRNLTTNVDYLVKKEHDLSLRIGFDGNIKIKSN